MIVGTSAAKNQSTHLQLLLHGFLPHTFPFHTGLVVASTTQFMRINELLVSAMKIDFRLVVEEACAELGVHILAKGIEFDVTMPEAAIMVSGDRVFLTEALKNLLDNAVKHGGTKLSRISVVLQRDEGAVSVTVADDGAGLSPDQSEAAFSRFSQLDYSEGSGLGLSIVSAVAQRHGGSVSINQVEKGASIMLELPIAL